MDSADLEPVRHAVSSQGAILGQHSTALQEIMGKLHDLSLLMETLQDSLQDPPPAPELVASAAANPPREPWVSPPERYDGNLGQCKTVSHAMWSSLCSPAPHLCHMKDLRLPTSSGCCEERRWSGLQFTGGDRTRLLPPMLLSPRRWPRFLTTQSKVMTLPWDCSLSTKDSGAWLNMPLSSGRWPLRVGGMTSPCWLCLSMV